MRRWSTKLDAPGCRDRRRLPAQRLCQSGARERALPSIWRSARPALKVSCSSALNAEIREYERTSTTVLNALLIPVIAGYLDKLARPHAGRAMHAAPAAGAVERRRVQHRDGRAGAGAPAAVGTLGRQRRVRAARPGAGRGQHRRRRHGRHQLRRVGRARRPGQPRDAGRDRSDAGAPADGGDPHHRRRRRLDRHGARGRTADRRAARVPARGRAPPATAAAASEPTVTDANRRARPARWRELSRRRHAARRGRGSHRHRRRTWRSPLGLAVEAGGRGPARRHQRQPRRRDPPLAVREGPRSARLRR